MSWPPTRREVAQVLGIRLSNERARDEECKSIFIDANDKHWPVWPSEYESFTIEHTSFVRLTKELWWALKLNFSPLNNEDNKRTRLVYEFVKEWLKP